MDLSIESTGGQLPALYGSLTALLLPGTLSIIISFIKPEKFDWEKLKQVNLLVDGDSSSEVEIDNDTPTIPKEKQDGVEVNFESDETSSLEQQQQSQAASQLTVKEMDFGSKSLPDL